MQRATLIIATTSLEEEAAATEWFEEWSTKMTYISDNIGCGCCVNIFNVEGPSYAVDAIPQVLCAQSDWTRRSALAAPEVVEEVNFASAWNSTEQGVTEEHEKKLVLTVCEVLDVLHRLDEDLERRAIAS